MPFAMQVRSLVALICLLTVGHANAADELKPGWVDKMPPDVATLSSSKRSNVFYVGEPISFQVNGSSPARYEVRDYRGEVVDKGVSAANLTLKNEPSGWYKLYLFRKEAREPWGNAVGGTTFVVFRNNPHFPPLPPKDTPSGSYPSSDEPMRGVCGMGPQRLFVPDASKPDEAIQKLESDIALDKKFYLPYDPIRKRVLMVAFPNGTKDLNGVRKIVEHFKNDVLYWEPRNEPNGGSNGTDFTNNEMKPFYETVKSVSPNLKVMGPGTVSIGPFDAGLKFIEDFLKAGGAKYLDAFSFHAYNTVNGDLWLTRKGLDSLNVLLKQYGADKLEKWQTEQGYFAAMYGAYLPTHQGRWTMLQMMVYEQYGIPKEHNHLWYDKSHGFWDFPTWWENDDGSLNPAAPLMRVWAEELYGTQWAKAYNFGGVGNKLFVGNLFEGAGKRTAAFMSAGSTDGEVTLKVRGGSKLHLVSAFGRESDILVKNGQAVLSVPELPVYVELAQGQTIDVVPTDWGPDLALASGTTAAASGTGQHPADKNIANPITKIINGELENWYWSQKRDTQPWMDDTPTFPAWVEVRLPTPTKISRVVIYATPPWQWQGSLLDYELQYDDGGTWKTLEHVQEPTRTFKVLTPITRTSVDSFYSDRWIFTHHFQSVTTQKIRLLVHNTTFGGGATEEVVKAGGQTGPHHINLREIEIYAK